VAMPVLASTITTCVVFLPVIYLTGIARFLFSPLAISVVLAMAASYVFAMMIIPVFAARFLRKRAPDAKESVLARAFASFQASYGRCLETVLGHKRLLSAAVLALLAASAAFVPFTGYELFPRVDAGTFILHLRAKSGTRVEKLERDVVEKVEALV